MEISGLIPHIEALIFASDKPLTSMEMTELLNNARNAQALTYNATPVVAAALIYLVMLWPLVRLVSRLEHKSIALR